MTGRPALLETKITSWARDSGPAAADVRPADIVASPARQRSDDALEAGIARRFVKHDRSTVFGGRQRRRSGRGELGVDLDPGVRRGSRGFYRRAEGRAVREEDVNGIGRSEERRRDQRREPEAIMGVDIGSLLNERRDRRALIADGRADQRGMQAGIVIDRNA